MTHLILIFVGCILAGILITEALSQVVSTPSPIAAVCAVSASPAPAPTGSFVRVQCNSLGALATQ